MGTNDTNERSDRAHTQRSIIPHNYDDVVIDDGVDVMTRHVHMTYASLKIIPSDWLFK